MGRSFGDAAGDAWAGRFLKHLEAGAAAVGLADPRGVRNRTREAALLLLERRGTMPAHRKARVVFGLCSLVLAGYREALAGLGDPGRAAALVGDAFHRTYRAPVGLITRLWLGIARDPVGLLSKVPMAKIAGKVYGTLMSFGQEFGEGHVDFVVTRCAFHQFFVEAGEPWLTRIFCGWDRNWMDVIDGSGRPVRTERPSTISTGGDCCRFRFIRDGSGKPAPTVDVALGDLVAPPGR